MTSGADSWAGKTPKLLDHRGEPDWDPLRSWPDNGHVVLVGQSEVHELAEPFLREGKHLSGEPISERNTIIETDLGIKELTVARSVEIHKFFDVSSDRLSNFGTTTQSPQCGGEAVRPVGGVAQPRQTDHGGGAPIDQEFLCPLQVVEEASAQMRNGVGVAIDEKPESSIPSVPVLCTGGSQPHRL